MIDDITSDLSKLFMIHIKIKNTVSMVLYYELTVYTRRDKTKKIHPEYGRSKSLQQEKSQTKGE
jgi:hypothetical protein